MKRYILSLIAAATMLCANAQTEVLKINLGDTTVIYKVADIQEMTFDTVEEQADTTLFHSFNGYITVSTAYFTDTYYGNDAQLGVFKTSEDEYLVTFSDPTWGDAFFGHVQIGQALSAEGTIKMFDRHSGGYKSYDCTLSGPMTTPVITIPSLMGGTSITFHVGAAPAGYLVAGKYDAARSVTIPAMPQMGTVVQDTVSVTLAAGTDPATANITLPACTYNGMELPEITLEGIALTDDGNGSYTIAETSYEASGAAGIVSGTVAPGSSLSLHVTMAYGSMPFELSMDYSTPVEPELYVTAGQHKGGVSVMVGGQFGPYTQTDITYGIEDNGDGTINVVIPGFQLSGTVMGDLTLGAYTVSNVAYDLERGAYYRDYSADGLTFHLTAVNNGATTMDNDYDFTRLGTIEVKATEAGGVSVVNTFQPGAMPFPVESVFEGNIE